ncbi:3-keto-5-aminohexanoate cleavage protein [Micromonospora sp. NPDC048839]|uniref:3-keto-5-aminohexanoate cleavage protein n=1 Tax=Micromonospora sp. NPDC048839 TaxID=3155641 RepID=UPI0033CD6239
MLALWGGPTVKACLNGGRGRDVHPAVPITRLHARIGLEDTLLLPDGTPAPHNAALVTAALAAGAH